MLEMCYGFLTCSISFKPHNTSYEDGVIIIPNLEMKNWGSERLNYLVKMTQLIRIGAGNSLSHHVLFVRQAEENTKTQRE